jgi:Type IV secretion-system coupling protein DNA-binding domain
MLSVDGVVHLSASDLVGHLNCHYLTKLDLAVAKGELDKPSRWDPVLELLAERGALHEQSYLDHLELSGLSITRINGIGIDPNAVEQTLDAMRRGVPIIAQGALRVGLWGGRADVLRRIEKPSGFGAWSYEVIDTKLARETKGNTVLQICLYSDLLAEASGKLTNSAGATFLECTKAKVLDAADGIKVNPLEIPLDPHSGQKQSYIKVVYQVANSLAKIFGLGDIQHAILRDAINQAFVAVGFSPNNKETWQRPAPNFSNVWTILKHMEEEIGGNIRNLNLRVQPLFATGVFPDNPDPRSFLEEPHILRLSNLATPELMVAVSRFALQKIYADMLAKGPSHTIRVFAVVDEAHKLSYEETLTELIREARKYGVGIVLASQSVKDFDRVVFDMVGTKIALQLEGDDAKVMADNLGLVDKQERDIARQVILNQAPTLR